MPQAEAWADITGLAPCCPRSSSAPLWFLGTYKDLTNKKLITPSVKKETQDICPAVPIHPVTQGLRHCSGDWLMVGPRKPAGRMRGSKPLVQGVRLVCSLGAGSMSLGAVIVSLGTESVSLSAGIMSLGAVSMFLGAVRVFLGGGIML